MGYKIVPEEDRYMVVDKDSYGFDRRVTPNLAEGEIRIDRLLVEGCPLKEFCVRVVNRSVSNICKYLGAYPVSNGDNFVFDKVFCEKDSNEHSLKTLTAGKQIKAGDINSIHIPMYNRLEKSNAFVVMR